MYASGEDVPWKKKCVRPELVRDEVELLFSAGGRLSQSGEGI